MLGLGAAGGVGEETAVCPFRERAAADPLRSRGQGDSGGVSPLEVKVERIVRNPPELGTKRC